MAATRINLYLLREVAVPTALGLAIFTFVLVMGRTLKLVEMVVNKGVPAGEIALLFTYLMPAFLVITLPLSFLLGTLLGFGRLSADSEIIALKSSGISLYGMLRPVIALALITCAATAALTLWGEPAGNAAFRGKLFQIAASRASAGIQPRVFNDEFGGLVIYADRVDEKTGAMRGIFISDERMDNAPATVMAALGRMSSDRETMTLTLRLEDGAIHRRPKRAEDTYQTVRFSSYDIALNLGQTLADNRPRKAKEMTLPQLREAARQAATPEKRNAFITEMHQRFILPFAPLLFAFLGVPLGIRNQRSGRGGGFAIGLAVFLLYYLLQSFTETLVVDVGLPAAVLWAPTCVLLGAGIFLIRQSALERSLPLASLLTGVSDSLRRLRRAGRGA